MTRAWLGLLPVFAGLMVVLMGALLLNMGTRLMEPEDVAYPADEFGLPTAPAREPDPYLTQALGKQLGFTAAQVPAQLAAGDALFKGNCAQCHAINEVVVGPALAGLGKRRTTAWLIPWIKNSSKVVACGDEYAVALYNKYQKQQMPSFQLSKDEIRAILLYVEAHENDGATSCLPPAVASAD